MRCRDRSRARSPSRRAMAEPLPPMKWWGWGDPSHPAELPPHALDFLRAELGVPGERRPPPALEDVRAARRRAPAQGGAEARAGGGRGVGARRPPDARHARRRQGLPGPRAHAPRRRRRPRRTRSCIRPTRRSFAPCSTPAPRRRSPSCRSEAARASWEASSRCGTAWRRSISLDLGRMAKLEGVDERSLTADFGPGLRGPQVEEALARTGLTLGHFPQSFEYATVGGWVATRSAGQASTGYGSIEKLVVRTSLRDAQRRDRPAGGARDRGGARASGSCWWARRACSA